jgi:site-specific recombinase XerD
LANLQVEDVNFSEGFLVVRTAKNGKPRVAPLSPIAKRSIRRFLNSPLSEPAVEVVEVVV